MCGIVGLIYKDITRPVAQDLLKSMLYTMNHRGPDDEGMFIHCNVAIAHKRLSIIDLSSGHQPMFNEDKTKVIVFNGEIYNHEELKRDLLKKGHCYSTKSDTETIIHAFEEYGTGCLSKLRGMFAFAIYDLKKKQLFIARDRVGKKPLYYLSNDKQFIFASEIKAILKTGNYREVNEEMIDFYLSLGYVPGQQTLFKNIYKLEPGHYLIINAEHKIQDNEYWDIRDIQVREITHQDACMQLKEKLLESVRIRLMSEVPLGVFLSGGLDSSTIVALMSQFVSGQIKTFSVGYKGKTESELNYARIIANKYQTEHYEYYLEPDDLFDSIDNLLKYSEEPIVESAGIALFKLSKLAKSQATVLLSGEGADEILAGYPIYSKMGAIENIYNMVKSVPTVINIIKRFTENEKLIKYLDWISEPFKDRYKSLSYDLSTTIKNRIYEQGFALKVNFSLDKYFSELHSRINGSMLRKMLYIDTKTWLAEDILLKADRMTMAASIELRAPFLDHELIELCFSLPDRYKLYGNQGKYLLKEIMRESLPNTTIYRQKKGFPVPLTSWFRKELKERAMSLLLDKNADRGYFKKEYIKRLFERIERGEDLGRRIFSLVTLEKWHREYID